MTFLKTVMKIKQILNTQYGFRYILDDLNLASSFSRQLLYDSPVKQTARDISAGYEQLGEFYLKYVAKGNFTHTLKALYRILGSLRDIRGTLNKLASGLVLDDIELFEIKNLVIANEETRVILEETFIGIKNFKLENLEDLLNLLDPEKSGTNSFYIYEAYSNELAGVRSRLKENRFSTELLSQASHIEDQIRIELSKKISVRQESLTSSLNLLASLDLIIAKADQISRLGLSIPAISRHKSSFHGLFNPEIKELLNKEGKTYQKTDIEFEAGTPLLMTGANMGGKTVTLRNIALCQYLFQCGFGIPADSAIVAPVNEVFISMGDMQNIYSGLSSFAAEMEVLNLILSASKSGKKLLALIDEPARSTNPSEGTALVKALISSLRRENVTAIISTHYNITDAPCKRIRVTGFDKGKMNYAFIDVDDGVVPHEAINTARALGVDNDWLDMAEKMIVND